jgi:hypothetical protein
MRISRSWLSTRLERLALRAEVDLESITGELAELIFSIARKTLGAPGAFRRPPQKAPFDSAGWATVTG